MKQHAAAHRLLSLALVLALALGAAAPLVRCASAAVPANATHEVPPSESPCAAPCCALQAPRSSSDAPAAPLADRDLTRPDLLPAPHAQAGPVPASLAGPAALLLPRAMASPSVANRAHEPPAARPVRLHVFHAAFLN
jgi:hypothetical protein